MQEHYGARAESDLRMTQLKKHHLKLWKANATSRPALLPRLGNEIMNYYPRK